LGLNNWGRELLLTIKEEIILMDYKITEDFIITISASLLPPERCSEE